MPEPVVHASDVSVEFPSPHGTVRAVDGVSLRVEPGETVALVGESGCGKTTFARAVLGLQPLAGGEISVAGAKVRGVARSNAERVGMVWQDPYASLDPRWPIARSVAEPLRLARRKGDVGALLAEVGLDPGLGSRYPHQLSGGQRQRAAIARALALRPPLVICDEPTAALDLSIQAQILNLLLDLQASVGCSVLYISHDLLTVRFLAQRVGVMYMGQIVEEGPTSEVFTKPRHPYTVALMASAPDLTKVGRLPDAPPGELPDPHTRIVGCRFASRCPIARDVCREAPVQPRAINGVQVLCNFPGEVALPAGLET